MNTIETTTDTISNGSSALPATIRRAHERVFGGLERLLDGWFIELGARLVFAWVLLAYYLNSASTKLGEGFFGILSPSAGAYAQILPSIAEQYSYDPSAIPFFPWHLIVILGTVSEILLPVLIVLGLFTRVAAVGMIVFIGVQTGVDIAFHGTAAGAWFDTQPGQLVDQRTLWVFVLLVLMVKGAGAASVDRWLRFVRSPRQAISVA